MMTTTTVRVWKVDPVGPWGDAVGRFISASDQRRSLQFWVWDDIRGQLLASLCDEAQKQRRWVQVTYRSSRYGEELIDVQPVAVEASA